MPVTLVLDSYYFLEDVIPGTLQQLADEEVESALFRAIIDNGHRMLITDRGTRQVSIKREHETEANKRGLGRNLAVVLDQFKIWGVIANVNVPRRHITNLGGSHKVFIEDAVAGRVQYFLTEAEGWRQFDRNRHICPNLRVITAQRFIRIAGRTDL